MQLSYVIVTWNRRETLLQTLQKLRENTPLPPDQWEVWVVDNASTDGSADAAAAFAPNVNVIRRGYNEGIWARTYAFGPARGRYIVLIDDDSYPIGHAVHQMLAYMDAHPATAALVARVVLPSGQYEACAFPSVLMGGATCLRKRVLDEIGGFRREFFRQAEEYDLSFRIWQAGYSVERFEDILFRHEKVSAGRSSALVHRMDVRNNLILLERYLPAPLRREYRRDWIQRYLAIARHAGHLADARKGLWAGRWWRLKESLHGRQTVDPFVVEQMFHLEHQRQRVAAWAYELRLQRVVIAGFSKNLYATYRACREANLTVLAIADDNPAFANLRYRDLPVLPLAQATNLAPDGIVLSDINPAHIDSKLAQIAAVFTGPTLRLWEGRRLDVESAAQIAYRLSA